MYIKITSSQHIKANTNKMKNILYFRILKSSDTCSPYTDGRCLHRLFEKTDRLGEKIQIQRQGLFPRIYWVFISSANDSGFDTNLLESITKHFAQGNSVEKLLQLLDLAEFLSRINLDVLQFFCLEKKIVKCTLGAKLDRSSPGKELGAGYDFTVIEDDTIRGNIATISKCLG